MRRRPGRRAGLCAVSGVGPRWHPTGCRRCGPAGGSHPTRSSRRDSRRSVRRSIGRVLPGCASAGPRAAPVRRSDGADGRLRPHPRPAPAGNHRRAPAVPTVWAAPGAHLVARPGVPQADHCPRSGPQVFVGGRFDRRDHVHVDRDVVAAMAPGSHARAHSSRTSNPGGYVQAPHAPRGPAAVGQSGHTRATGTGTGSSSVPARSPAARRASRRCSHTHVCRERGG